MCPHNGYLKCKDSYGQRRRRAKPLFRHAGVGDGALMCRCWVAWLPNVSLGWLTALFDHGTGWQRSENDWMNSLSCYVWEKGKHFKLGQGVLENSAELSDKRNGTSGLDSVGVAWMVYTWSIRCLSSLLVWPVLAAARGVHLKQWQFYCFSAENKIPH